MGETATDKENDGVETKTTSPPRGRDKPFSRDKYLGGSSVENMILALSDEIDFADKNLQKQILKNGEFISELGGLYLYKFGLDGTLQFDPGVDVSVAINGNDFRGKVLQEELGAVTIGIETDQGQMISKIEITKAENALEKILRNQLIDVFGNGKSFNHERAKFVINAAKPKPVTKELPSLIQAYLNSQTPPWTLNQQQEDFLSLAQDTDFCILWGPPGCGKTTVIGLLTAAHLVAGKRVLLVSNSNKAVDGALSDVLNVDKTLSGSSTYGEGRLIIRPGGDGITEEFIETWGEATLLEQVVKQRSIEITAEREQLNIEKSEITPLLALIVSGLKLYHLSRDVAKQCLEIPNIIAAQKERLNVLDSQLEQHMRSIHDLEEEFASAPDGETLSTRIGFSRTQDVIKEDLTIANEAKRTTSSELKKTNDEIISQEIYLSALELKKNEIESQLAAHEPEDILQEKYDIHDPRLNDITKRLSEIDEELQQLETTVLREANVIGTTVHKTFIDSRISQQDFDVVIIDESSMVVLPMTYWAAGRSKKQVVVVGDFKQLPAIVKNTESPYVMDWMAKTPFDYCGVRTAINADISQLPDYVVALKEQNRMHEEIGRLVSDTFYDGTLTTGSRVLDRPTRSQLPGQKTQKRLILVDTTDIGSWSSPPFSGKGRFNPTHAAIAIALIDRLILSGQLTFDKESSMKGIGFVTPYAGQAELFLKATEQRHRAFIHDSSIGTAHRFQGSERDIVIFDYVISEERKYKSLFIDSELGDDQPGNLLNVALSRAKEHLVLMYNSREFNAEKKTTKWMLRFLKDYESRAETIDARELLNESSLLGAAREIANGHSFEIHHPSTVHHEASFYGGVRHDLMAAKKSVVIFSAFATPNNLSRWMDTFKSLLEKGVKLRIVTKPINAQPSPKRNGPQLAAMFDVCRQAGIAVEMRGPTHEKAVIIDETIVWHGSLNMLSQNKNLTAEIMTRMDSNDFAQEMLHMLSRHDLKRTDLALEQLPVCPRCGSQTRLLKTWKGTEYLECDNECGFSAFSSNFPDLARGIPIGVIQANCPKCSDGKMILARGYGRLYLSCSNRRNKKAKDKCLHTDKISATELPDYVPFPSAGVPDPIILDKLISKDNNKMTFHPEDIIDVPPPPQKTAKKSTSIRRPKKTSNRKKNKNTSPSLPRNTVRKKARDKTELNNFLSSLK